MSDYLEVVTTVKRLEDAEELAKGLVEERLAACVQILGPVKSVYRWKGRLEEAEEWLCLIKTRSSLSGRSKVSSRIGTPTKCQRSWPSLSPRATRPTCSGWMKS